MSNENMFYELCNIMAKLEDSITSFEKIGFIVEPGTEGTVSENLYTAASAAYRIASTLLNYPSVEVENNVCNELLSADTATMKEVSTRIWNEYGSEHGIKSDI